MHYHQSHYIPCEKSNYTHIFTHTIFYTTVYKFIIVSYIVFFTLIYYCYLHDVRKLLIVIEVRNVLYVRLWLFLANQNRYNKVDQNNNEKLRRTHRTSILFNQREQEAINLYCDKYKIRNKSKFMREVIMTEILKKFDEDYPTLFEFEKPNLFVTK